MKKPLLMLSSLVVSVLPLSVNAHGDQAETTPDKVISEGYQVVEVTNGGAITGKVTFSGEDPAPIEYLVTKDVEVCGKTRSLDFVKVNNGALSDVVVYLENVEKGKAFLEVEKQAKIEQKACDYGPLLSVMNQGAKLEIVNADKVAHKMHAAEVMETGTKKTMFNISQTEQGSVSKEVKLKTGPGMKMQCEEHEFMQSFMFVAKNPYYALVAEDGTFTIEDILPGNYMVKAWHGKLKNHPQLYVPIEAGKTIVVDFDYNK